MKSNVKHHGRLLSVDWDFFFPIPELDREYLYDWGHREDLALMLDGIWVFRAEAFIRRGKSLPDTDGSEKTFWNRFNFTSDATLFYADSHCNATSPIVMDRRITELWNFDAHHDAYRPIREVIKDMQVSCQDWVILYHLYSTKIKLIYPKWREWAIGEDKPNIPVEVQLDSGKPISKPFDKIFLCRSGAWTPTWLEDKFWNFLEDCPVKNKVKLDNITRRIYSQEEAEKLASQIAKQMREVK